MITQVGGVRVGHWTDPGGRTGCNVVLVPAGTVASAEVRGVAPGTRAYALLAPERLVQRLDAVVLTGGSAFGLASCDGVMRWCEERGIGYPTAAGPVPIVVGAVLFDRTAGDPAVRPGAEAGYAACEAASAGPVATGAVGAGAGATLGKWRRPEVVPPGGIGTAAVRHGEVVVGALFAVNAFGEIRRPADAEDAPIPEWPVAPPFAHTTIGIVATNASVDKLGCLLVAQSAHDGLARALEPAHATVDGDAVVAAAAGGVEAPVDLVRVLAVRATERAVRSVGAAPAGR